MKVEYYSHVGSDNMVADMARASFNKRSVDYPEERNVRLINYLARHNHWAPFGHPQITLYTEAPIFVARQDFKHQIGFVRSEASRRYVSDEPSFFVPDVWRKAAENKKQGSSDEVIEGRDDDVLDDEYRGFIYQASALYQYMLKIGVAPEQARMVLPQSMYTSYYVTGSLSAWARAYKLRIDEHSQKEIQDLAHMWGNIIGNIPELQHSWAALTTTGN